MSITKNNFVHPFWILLKEKTGGLPGQERWKSANRPQWTKEVNEYNDRIMVYIGNPSQLMIYISGSRKEQGEDRVRRMQQFSQAIIDNMSDQRIGSPEKTIKEMSAMQIENYIDSESHEGRSIRVKRKWSHNAQDEWPETVSWVNHQFNRLKAIATGKSA